MMRLITSLTVSKPFQYPNKRVILPDIDDLSEYDFPELEFQYPNKRVILPDALREQAQGDDALASFNTPISG